MSASPIGPMFAGMLWRTAKAMNELHGAGPPAVEYRQCFTCHGDGFVDDGTFDVDPSPRCPTCRGARVLPYEVRR